MATHSIHAMPKLKRPSRVQAFVSQYVKTQIDARAPSLVKSAALIAFAGLASLFALVWLSFSIWTALHDGLGWSRPAASFGTTLVFVIAAAVGLALRKKVQTKMQVRREIEKDLAEVPGLAPGAGLMSAAREDMGDALRVQGDVLRQKGEILRMKGREKGEEAMIWVQEHPFRAAAVGAASGWLVGLWTRKSFNTSNTIEGI